MSAAPPPRWPEVLRAAAGLLLPLLLVAIARAAAAEPVHGRLQLGDLAGFARGDSLDAAVGVERRNDVQGDLRLTWEPGWGRWRLVIHDRLAGDVGGGVTLARREAGSLPPVPPATLFDLTNTLLDEGDRHLAQTVDRLSLSYAAPDFVVRVGRQALTWGAGMLFHPLDLIDPFAPDAVDTEYKPGVDMAYGQWLLADGSDLQVVAVPRPVTRGGPVRGQASTMAAAYRWRWGDFGLTGLAARDRGDWTLGLAISGALGGAAWNAELVPTRVPGGRVDTSALVNISDAASLFGRDATLFAEYYRNGFGKSGVAFDQLPAPLADRLARGQLFTTARDYVGAGLTLDWTPLLSLAPNAIVNLDDGSLYAAASATWSLTDNASLIAGAQVPIGGFGSEYGGLPLSGVRLSGARPPTLAPASLLYMLLRQHF